MHTSLHPHIPLMLWSPHFSQHTGVSVLLPFALSFPLPGRLLHESLEWLSYLLQVCALIHLFSVAFPDLVFDIDPASSHILFFPFDFSELHSSPSTYCVFLFFQSFIEFFPLLDRKLHEDSDFGLFLPPDLSPAPSA